MTLTALRQHIVGSSGRRPFPAETALEAHGLRSGRAAGREGFFPALPAMPGLQALSPSLHFSPPDGRSTRYDRQDFVALACRAQRTVKYACARQAARASS